MKEPAPGGPPARKAGEVGQPRERPQVRIKVRNWKRFQHYSTRNPPWIKLYQDLLEKREWYELTPEASRLLVEVWLLVSQESTDGSLSIDLYDLTFKLRYQHASKVLASLELLEAQEFIDVENLDAIKSLAGCEQSPLYSVGTTTPREGRDQSKPENYRGLSSLVGVIPESARAREVVGAVAETAHGSLDTWALGFAGMYGPDGTRVGEIQEIPEDERPAVLLDALQAYLAEGQPWDQRFFSGFLRNAVKRHLGGEGPDFGDENERDQQRRQAARARAARRAQEDIDLEHERAERETEELREWYEEQPQEVRDEISDEAAERVQALIFRAGMKPTPMMQNSALVTAIKRYRGES